MFTTRFLNMIAGNAFQTQTTPAFPAALYIGLSTTAPDVDGTGYTEPSAAGTAYARVRLDGLSVPNDGFVENENIIAFEESLSSWGTVTHYLVFDAETDGNLLVFEPLEEARSVEARTVLMFKPGEVKLGVANEQA